MSRLGIHRDNLLSGTTLAGLPPWLAIDYESNDDPAPLPDDERYAEGMRSAFRTIVQAVPDKKLAAFANVAREISGFVKMGGVGKQYAVDQLEGCAVENGLNTRYGQDKIQQTLSEAFATAVPQTTAPTAPNSANGSSLVYRCAADIVPEAIQWLWPGRIAVGKQTLIAGEPGLGKSQLAIAAVAVITTGGQWPCGEGVASTGKAIFLCAEDDAADTIVPRLMAVQANLKKIGFITAVKVGGAGGVRSFNLQADLALLESRIAELEDVRIVVIDPISSYMGKVDSHKNADVRSVLELVGEMAARLRVAVLGITHFSKGGDTKAINRFIGSIAFIAAARAAFAVVQDPDDESRRLFMPVKNNLAPLGNGLAFRLEQHLVADDILASCIAWDSNPVTGTADSILAASSNTGAERSTKAEAADFLQDMLANGPMPSKELEKQADAAGYSWATIKRAKKHARIEHYREGGTAAAGHWLWRLPNAPICLTGSPKAYLAHATDMSQLGEFEPVRGSGGGL